MKKVKAKDLVSFSQISRHLAGNDNSIRKDKTPECYKEPVNELMDLVDGWLKKHKR